MPKSRRGLDVSSESPLIHYIEDILRARLYLVAAAALALSACSGGGSTPSTPKNPTSIVITTNVTGTPTAGISVTLSTALTGDSDNVPSGTIVGTVT